MGKLTLNPDPTFKTKVGIPLPGGKKAPVGFEFKHKDRDQLKDFMERAVDMTATEMVTEIAVGWEFDDELNAENIERLTKNYMGAGRAIFDKYVEELGQVKLGNSEGSLEDSM